jgi:mRNA N6-methyladenine demethylase
MSKAHKRPRDGAARPAGARDSASKKARRKAKSAGGGGDVKRAPGDGSRPVEAPSGKIPSRPPPSYRLSTCDTDEASAASVLRPGDDEYEPCVRRAYAGFHVDPPESLPRETHDAAAGAFESMRAAGLFHRDVLAAGNVVSPTFVRRVLVGDRGMTYHYQKLRIFAHSWHDDDLVVRETTNESRAKDDLSPLRVVRELNETLKARSASVLRQTRYPPNASSKLDGSCDFNVTLINLMDAKAAALKSDVPLKDESKYGMGPTSVSWHSDSSLQPHSTVAVYHVLFDENDSKRTTSRDDSSWHVALRTLDGRTPALRVPLPSESTYYMLRDFNAYHHHAVLAGNTRRYSSTHRVAVVEKDTFDHIKRVCVDAVRVLPELKAMAETARRKGRGKGAKNVDFSRLARLTQTVGDAHRETEFQWLRMFWLQGEEHAQAHSAYWRGKIEELTQAWDAMELGLRWVLECLRFCADASTPSQTPPTRNYDLALYVLTAVAEAREAYFKRASSAAYAKLPETQKPVRRPAFTETSPLPENLRPVVAALTEWKKKAERFRRG